MIQRSINPKPRFITLICSVPSTGTFVGSPFATLHRQSFLRIPQDSIIHYVSINSTFLANGVASQVIGSVIYGQDQATIGYGLNPGLQNIGDGTIWRDELLNPAAGVITTSKSVQIMMNEFFCHTETGFGIYVNGTNGTAHINATIAFNPIAEWINFREPTTTVRI